MILVVQMSALVLCLVCLADVQSQLLIDSSTHLPSLPFGIERHIATYVNNSILIFGGKSTDTFNTSTFPVKINSSDATYETIGVSANCIQSDIIMNAQAYTQSSTNIIYFLPTINAHKYNLVTNECTQFASNIDNFYTTNQLPSSTNIHPGNRASSCITLDEPNHVLYIIGGRSDAHNNIILV